VIIDEIKDRKRLFKSQPYTLFTLSGIMATFGNGLIYVAMSWYVYQLNNSISGIALLMFCIWMPSIVFGPLFGVCADRFNRKHLLILSNAVRGIAIIGYTYLLFKGYKIDIYYLAVVLGIFVSFYMPAAIPFVKEIVDDKDLISANATVDMLYELGTIAGMGASGILMLKYEALGTFTIGGCCFAISALLNYLMQYQRSIKKEKTRILSFLADYVNSLKYLLENRHLLRIYSIQMIVMVLLMTIPILIVPYTRIVFNADASQFARFEAMFSIGVFVGGFFSPILCRILSTKTTLMILMLILTGGLFFFWINNSIVPGYFVYLAIGFGLSSWAIAISQAQLQTHEDFQGRLQATAYSFTGIGVLFIYLVITFKSDFASIQSMYLIESIIAAIAVILVLRIKTESLIKS